LRALLEGICFNLFEVAGLLEERGCVINEIFASGGFTRSPFWVQLAADIFGRPVTIDENEDASAMGAILLAKHALGSLPRLDSAPGFARRSLRYLPDAGQGEKYRAYFEQYRRLYPALRAVFEALGELEGRI
jgi:gluconokinase